MASVADTATRGKMLWFNAEKDLGALRTDDGVRLELSGEAFPAGEKPVGRCAGREVEFELEHGDVKRIAFVPEIAPRRARKRHGR